MPISLILIVRYDMRRQPFLWRHYIVLNVAKIKNLCI